MEHKCKKVVLNGVEYTPKKKDFFRMYIDKRTYFNSYDIGLEEDFAAVLNKKGKNIISLYGVDFNEKGIDLIGLEIDWEDIMLYKDSHGYYVIVFNINNG